MRPGPGAPVWVEQGRVEVQVDRMAATWALRDLDGARWPLGVAGVEPAGSGWRVRLDVPAQAAPVPPTTSRVFDLIADGQTWSRSVAWHVGSPGRLRLGFASDLHVAAIWEQVHEAVRLAAPDLRFVHPGAMVAALVAEATALWQAGELDVLVLGGDLVDHVYARPRAEGPSPPNVAQLVAELASLPVPTLAIPGNHDRRLYPYRLRTYGLKGLGVPHTRLPEVLRAAGLWDPWPVRSTDVDAVRTAGGLAHHRALLAAEERTVRLAGIELVLLDSGPDAFTELTAAWQAGPTRLVRSLLASWGEPDSLGPASIDVDRVRQAVARSGSATVLVHAPLVSGEPASLPLDEAALRAADRRRGVCLRGMEEVLDALGEGTGPSVVVSGHRHEARAWAVDHRQGRVGPAQTPRPGTTTLLTAPAVGHVGRGAAGAPGWLRIGFEEGVVRSWETRRLLDQ